MNGKNNKDAALSARVSVADKARISKLAKQSGLTVSEYVARAATAQVEDNDEAIKAFMQTDSELVVMNLWFNTNIALMQQHGHVLAPDVKAAWTKFMEALTEQVATTFTAKLEQRRTTLSN